jgi:hypothetical protein
VTKVSSCVVCSGSIELRTTALVAPFLSRRIWGRDAFGIDVAECVSCGFIFYNPRLTSDEEERLYTRYRSDEYQQMRFSTEPWYTPRFNRNLRGASFFAVRRTQLAKILGPYLPLGRPRILDFGGDQGELVNELIPGAEPYVYDISGVAPVGGVGRCCDLVECRSKQFDLILNSNVLEHVGFPRAIMDQITSIATPETLAYIEVPSESPFDKMTMLKRLVQGGVLVLSRPKTALTLARPGLLYLMHEHVNFFNHKSLRALMTASNWSVVALDSYHLDSPSGKASMTWCLAKRAR